MFVYTHLYFTLPASRRCDHMLYLLGLFWFVLFFFIFFPWPTRKFRCGYPWTYNLQVSYNDNALLSLLEQRLFLKAHSKYCYCCWRMYKKKTKKRRKEKKKSPLFSGPAETPCRHHTAYFFFPTIELRCFWDTLLFFRGCTKE